MFTLARNAVFGTAILGGMAVQASAADLYQPPVIETPPPVYNIPPPPPAPEMGGWYIRGDLDYHALKMRGSDYITYGCATCGPTPGTNAFATTDLKSTLSLGGGIGYQINKHFRADLTGDYLFRSTFTGSTTGTSCTTPGVPCTSTDQADFNALLLMANAYAELGTWGRITPYVGAGIGGARVKWGDLSNTITGGTSVHAGATSWRFAWALMAGASYCINDHLSLDLGYRYARISGGRMFEETTPGGVSIGVGPGFDHGFNMHEGRAGLRYAIGGGNSCGQPETIAWTPPPALPPVYK